MYMQTERDPQYKTRAASEVTLDKGRAVTGTVEYKSYKWGTDHMLLRSLQERAAVVNERVFRLNPLQTADEIYHHMQRESRFRRSIIFATSNNRDIGFCVQELMEVPLYNKTTKSVVWTAIRAVDSKYQRRGIGTEMIRRGFAQYENEQPDYYGGRSQVDVVFLSLIKSRLFSEVLPLGRQFKGAEMQVVRYLAEQIMYPRPVNAKTGLIKGAYPEGAIGGCAINLENPGIRWVRERFAQFGLVKEEGDALIYLAIPNRGSTVYAPDLPNEPV